MRRLPFTATAGLGMMANLLSMGGCARSRDRTPATEVDPPTIVQPARPDRTRPTSGALVDRPVAVDTYGDLTMTLRTVVTSARGSRVQTRTVTRSRDRLHVETDQPRGEWIFMRNPKDERRVFATRVDHERRALVEFSESELRADGIARDWASVACLGLRPELFDTKDPRADDRPETRTEFATSLTAPSATAPSATAPSVTAPPVTAPLVIPKSNTLLEPSGRRESFGGFEFEGWSPPQGGDGTLRELWWSREACAPLRLTIVEDGITWKVNATSLSRSIDRRKLEAPSARYPDYRSIDSADARESVHDHAPITSIAAP